MTISFPVSPPAVWLPSRWRVQAHSTVGVSRSPFTAEQQVYAHLGEFWTVEVSLPAMARADAEACIAFLLSLSGMEGTVLFGDPVGAAPRGTWAGSPKVSGAHAARVKSILMDGFTAGATGKAGDWLQFGTGSSAHLHKVVEDFTADGSGIATAEIWPATRAALADDATFVTSGAKGLWRRAANDQGWDIELAQVFGLQASFLEAL